MKTEYQKALEEDKEIIDLQKAIESLKVILIPLRISVDLHERRLMNRIVEIDRKFNK